MSTPLGSSQWMYSSGEAVTQQSLKFNDDESQYLSWTPASAGNRKTWTWSGWVKRGNVSSFQGLFASRSALNDSSYMYTAFNSSDTFQFSIYSTTLATTSQVFRDPSAWYHIVVAFDATAAAAADRLKIYVNGLEAALSTDNRSSISNQDYAWNQTGLHFISGRYVNSWSNGFDGYLSDVNFIDGQALDADDFGETVNGYWKAKDYAGTYGTNGFHLTFEDDVVSEGFNAVTYRGTGASQSISGLGLNPDFVWVKQRSGSTRSHRLNDSVRGANKQLYSDLTNAEGTATTELTSFDSDGFSLGSANGINNSGDTYVAWAWDAGENNAPTGHSSVTYTGNGGTQSIKGLGFEPDLVWLKSRSAGYNHVIIDSVRGIEKQIISNSTSTETQDSGKGLTSFDSDGFTVTLGTSTSYNNSGQTYVGWAWDAGTDAPASNTDGTITSTVKANPDYGFSIVSYTGNGSSGQTVGHGLGVAPDLLIMKNRDDAENWQVNHSSITDGVFNLNTTDSKKNHTTSSAGAIDPNGNTSTVFSMYDGSSSTNYPNESGKDYIVYCFAEVAGYSSFGSYTGTGSSGNSVTGLGFRPGFVMIKRTDGGTNGWMIYDGTRDPINNITSRLKANASDAEDTGDAISFGSDGFTIEATGASVNGSGNSYIYMAFKGSYSDYVSDYNTDGTIDSRVKSNPAKGFSIASYTGNNGSSGSFGHGLNVAPNMVIIKSRTDAANWAVGHDALTSWSYYIALNNNAAEVNDSANFNGTAPTSTVVNIGGSGNTNDAENYIAYCFHSVAGYSKISSYTGTGSTHSVTLGFRPAFVMLKRTSSTFGWVMLDNTRDPDNIMNARLDANSNNSESTGERLRFTSTGFDVTAGTDAAINNSGSTYIYIAFADTREAAFWKDVSGQGNHWTPNNLDYRDSLPDSPANNFATLSPLAHNLGTASSAIFEGNLKVVGINATNRSILSTHGISSGKWYFETVFTLPNGFNAGEVGFREVSQQLVNRESDNSLSYSVIVNQSGAWGKRNSGTYTSISTSNYTSGSTVVGVAFDADAGTFSISKDGVWEDNIFTSITSGTYQPFATVYYSGGSFTTSTLNFGQDSTFAGAKPMGAFTDDNELGTFQHQPPAGFKSLCTANLPTPTILDGSEYFNTVLYTGNGGTQSITGANYQPDFVWLKQRSGSSRANRLNDSVRGANKQLYSNLTNAEGTATDELTSFDSDGFSLGSANGINNSGDTYASWNWKAGGTAVSNTDGSITSQVSANTDAGFSVISYVGTGSPTNAGHGLSQKPEMTFWKNRDESIDWFVFHTDVGPSSRLSLNDTIGAAASGGLMNHTDHTDTLLSIGNAWNVNKSGSDIICYAFHSVDGYSKVGSYTGNGSSDGPFVYTGFRPAWVMIKRTDSGSGDWRILDNMREGRNPDNDFLEANDSQAEASANPNNYFDIVSNGFKIRNSSSSQNANGGTYIYLAFAETPFKFANAR